MLSRILLIALTVLASVPAWASPCIPGAALSTYVALGSTGCQVGGLTVKDFAFSVLSFSNLSVVISDNDVFVMPTANGSRLALNFTSSGFSVTGNDFVVYLLAYTWDPGDIRGLDDELTTDSPIAPGKVTITTDACLGGVFNGPACSNPMAQLMVFHDGLNPVLFDSVTFSPVGVVGIRNTIDLHANGASANFTGIGNGLTNVPEPANVLLAGLALLVMGCFRLKGREIGFQRLAQFGHAAAGFHRRQ
jgi:hypothetical protein